MLLLPLCISSFLFVLIIKIAQYFLIFFNMAQLISKRYCAPFYSLLPDFSWSTKGSPFYTCNGKKYVPEAFLYILITFIVLEPFSKFRCST